MARPKAAAELPAVIVVHENRGLNAHIEDVTRRVALEGFVALAPDLLSAVGGTPGNGMGLANYAIRARRYAALSVMAFET